VSTASTLVQASPLVAAKPLRFELEIDGHGTWAAGPEDATPRLRVRSDPAALAELLDGRRATRARLQGRFDVDGSRRRARRHLGALGRATRSPADLARAGARLDPLLLARAIATRMDPVQRPLTVVVSLSEATFTVSTAGGLTVESGAPDFTPDATVTTTTMAFYRWLSGEAIDAGVDIAGDADAVALLAGAAERALC
jgi:hypothetical protein